MEDKGCDVLIEGLKAGDRDSFNTIFRSHYEPLVRYCYRFVDDKDTSEEIVQNMFVRLWARRSELNVNHSLKSYLYRSAQNSAFNYLLTQKSQNRCLANADFSMVNEFDNPLETVKELDLKDKIQDSLLQMPDKRREVFILSRYEGLKNKEIADKLNLSVKTVEGHMTKAIEQLRDFLKDYSTIVVLFLLLFL